MKNCGYRPSHRNRWILIRNNILSKGEFLFFEYILDQMDFDKNHRGYGTFQLNFEEACLNLGYSANPPYNSIRKKLDKLLKLGFIQPTPEEKIFEVYSPDRYVVKSKKWQGKAQTYATLEKNENCSQIIQNIASNVQFNERTIQNNEEKHHNNIRERTSRHLSSSKVCLSKKEEEEDSRKIASKLKNDSFYQQVYQSLNGDSLSIEDMKYLDSPEYLNDLSDMT